jgi:hypothetical protein
MRDTLIKHKEPTLICEESGPNIANYNVLIIQLESKLVTQPITTYTTTRQKLTCSNYGKTCHAKETCDNEKKKELTIHVVHTKVVELVDELTTQPVESTKVPLRYPCIICFSFEHHAPDCL